MSHIGYPRCNAKIPYYSHAKGKVSERPCCRRAKVGKFLPLCKPCDKRTSVDVK